MTAKPRVSVVLPVYNGERYIGEAIESVLNQTVVVDELIVVDDGSTDGSVAIAMGIAPGALCLSQANAGAGAARNAGVALARGEYLAFLDADDWWERTKIEHQLEAFAADPGLEIVTGMVEQFLSPELDRERVAGLHCPSGTLPGYVFGAMLLRRGVFDRVGPIATGYRLGEPVEWWGRAQGLGMRVRALGEVVLHRRIHLTNQGVVYRQAAVEYARALKANLDRRRLAAARQES